jgi:hypothetical protein
LLFFLFFSPIGGPGQGMGQATAAVALAPGSAGANMAAIDNKIEQAMVRIF